MTNERNCAHCGSENVMGIRNIISSYEEWLAFPLLDEKKPITGVHCLDCGKLTKFEERVI